MPPDADPLVVRLRGACDAIRALRFALDPHELPPDAPDDRRDAVITGLLTAKRTCVEQLRATQAELESGVGRVPRVLREGGLGSRYAGVVQAVMALRASLEPFDTSPGHGKMPMRGRPQPGGDAAADTWDRAERQLVDFVRDLRIALLMESGDDAPSPSDPTPVAATAPPPPVATDDPLLRVLSSEHVRKVRDFRIPFPLDEFHQKWSVGSVDRFGKTMTQGVSGAPTALAVAETLLNAQIVQEDRRAEERGGVPPQRRLTRMSAIRGDGQEVVVFDATQPAEGLTISLADLQAMPEPTATELKALAEEMKAIRAELDREEAQRERPPFVFPGPPTKPVAEKEEDLLAKLAAETPPLDRDSQDWVKNTDAAKIENIATATLTSYRSQGISSPDQRIGRDRNGRVWRRTGTTNSHVWYLRSSLGSEKKK
jgi:hypothetical protein